MNKIKKGIILAVFFVICLLINSKVFAASTSLDSSNYSITTGETTNISVGVNSTEAWQLNLSSSGGSLSGNTNDADVYDGESTQNVMNASFSSGTAGSYTITLSGYVTGSDLVKQEVYKSITITVSDPASSQQQSEPESQPQPQQVEETPVRETTTFSSRNETVYVTDEVNVRDDYGTTGTEVIGSLNKGDTVIRTGVSDDSVDRILLEQNII